MQVTKTRFFVPEEETNNTDQESQPVPTSEGSLFVPDEDDNSDDDENYDSQKKMRKSETRPINKSISLKKFESDIKSIVGDISPVILRYLYDRFSSSQESVRRAVDELFTNPPDLDKLTRHHNESKSQSTTTQRNSSQSSKTISTLKRSNSDDLKELNKRLHLASEAMKEEMKANSWSRYIGTLDVQAWATRPTMKPLQYQEKLTVKRLIPRNSTMQKSSIIRLCLNDREIGRLPEDLTRIFSPLIDLNIAEFQVIVLETTKRRLSTGDSFVVQIEIYLKDTGFVKNIDSIANPDLKKAGANFNFATESEGEAALRLRQFAISNLFDRLKLRPLKLSNDQKIDDDNVLNDAINENDVQIVDDDAESESEEPVDEVNLDQLRQFYQANNQSKLLESLPETTKPPETNFKLDLREYQKHGLSWMLAREKEVDVLKQCSGEDQLSAETQKGIEETGVMNPLWRKYKWPIMGVNQEDIQQTQIAPTQGQSDNYFYANLYNGELSTQEPIIKTSVKGGILADEMGLGKTIATLALINSVPYDTNIDNNKKRYASKTTLIVVPMSLLSQWKDEFEKANNNTQHVCRLYYGDQTESDLSRTLCNLDETSKIPIVVITTYGTVLNEYTRISKHRNQKGELPKQGLYSVKYFRIILDEGHNIRNRNTKTAKSVYELEANRKWVLTGTPIVNRLDDLYSLAKYLELDPWNNFSYWKTFVTLPFEQKKISQTLDVIKSILEPIFLRRTKNQKKNGKPLVQLPEKEVVIEEIKFNDQEAKLYQWFKSKAYESFSEGVKSGQLLRQYTQILTHILRLRQVCCHVDLIGGAHEMDDDVIDLETDEEMKKFLKSVKEQSKQFLNDTEVKQTMYKLYDVIKEENECSICTTSPIPQSELTITPCGHTFCISCILEHLDFQSDSNRPKLCPNCREPISKYKLFRVRNQKVLSNEIRFHTQSTTNKDYDFQIYLYDPNRTSSKIQALIKHLNILQTQAPNSKVIVFSQFASYLDILEVELKLTSNEFIVYKFDGRLNMNERSKLLNSFNETLSNGKIAILLLSLKAGGVGLNLTTASRAFMMDPWWSPSIEDQAIDRIHRIGQNETVKVVRFIMENSIETKMLKIQERKKQIGEAVGVEEEERRKRRIEEIQILFEE
ncbi:RAD5 [Candida pseudojiufengensis]|uniref:RAD5 n=1 Tax=Candida pseudojiufengensis TaxID=497109 RepID=UPI0022253E73|nr:RAD5 [Candida pseudojiufengensis]KAI5960598.1 RAD5 [Candida pseudojiufengensis]